jgi:hypothetical protein
VLTPISKKEAVPNARYGAITHPRVNNNGLFNNWEAETFDSAEGIPDALS